VCSVLTTFVKILSIKVSLSEVNLVAIFINGVTIFIVLLT
jgi:hypothetical protein